MAAGNNLKPVNDRPRAWRWILPPAAAAGMVLSLAGPSEPPLSSPGLAVGGTVELRRHETWVAGLRDRSIDVRNAAEVFRCVFAGLPSEVHVGPTENYYYWQLAASGCWLHGNIRLAVGAREQGIVEFAYGESRDVLQSLGPESERFAVTHAFTAVEGVDVVMQDALTAKVSYAGKSVVFRLNPLAQSLPQGFPLAPDERFLQRTEDDSGLRFLLLYHQTNHHFFWALDECDPVPDQFDAIAPDAVLARRTGFVFWNQPDPGPRKVLVSIRRQSLERNDHHDGPFDQLADNFVVGDGLRPFLEQAMPWLRGRVDPWGRLLDSPQPRRVALTCHGLYDRIDEAIQLLDAAKLQPHPLASLARGAEPRDRPQ